MPVSKTQDNVTKAEYYDIINEINSSEKEVEIEIAGEIASQVT